MESINERRRAERKDVEINVAFREKANTPTILSLKTKNISETGVFIESPLEMPVGEECWIEFSCPIRNTPVKIKSQFVHNLKSDDTQVGIGIQFKELGSRESSSLKSYLLG